MNLEENIAFNTLFQLIHIQSVVNSENILLSIQQFKQHFGRPLCYINTNLIEMHHVGVLGLRIS